MMLFPFDFIFNRPDMNDVYTKEFLRFKQNKSPKTVLFYKGRLSQFVKFAEGSFPPTPEMITAYLAKLHKQNLKPGSIHAAYRAIRAWCYWLHKSGRIDSNPIIQVDAPRIPKANIPRAPTDEAIAEILAFLEEQIEGYIKRRDVLRNWLDVRNLALITFLMSSGLRIGEAQHVLLDDVDCNRGIVRVSDKGKDRQERYAPFLPGTSVLSDLRLWLSVRDDIIDYSPTTDAAELQHVFISNSSSKYFKPLGSDGFYDAIQSVCLRADVEPITAHSLRHYYAIKQIQNGMDLMRLRDALGHSSIAVTDVYLRSPDTWL